MDLSRTLLAGAFLLTSTTAAVAGEVSVNGTPVPKAVSSIDATQEVTEFREATSPVIQLLPGSKRYGVCIEAQGPIAVLDAELPLAGTPSRFTVQVEDGRQFAQCLLTSLGAGGKGKKRRFTYCLRCEDVQNAGP